MSQRDMWVLRRASRLALHVLKLSDPEHDRARRHVLDWLRVEQRDGALSSPHWCHTYPNEEAGESEGETEYTSDEDDNYFCYQCPFVPGRRHPSAECCRCADNR